MNAEIFNPPAKLEERLRFETLIADLSSKFVNLPAAEVDREILDALRRVCALLDLDLLVFWQPLGEAPDTFSVTHFYYAPEGPASPEHFKEANYPWYKRELMAGRLASFAALEELPPEAARDRESFRQAGTKSNLSLPLMVGGGALIGAFCLNALRAEREWPDELVKRLQLVAQIFANALARKRTDQELRLLSLAVEQSPVLVVITDTQGKITYVNRKFTEVTGYSFAESLGQNPRFLKSGECSPAVYKELWACITSGRTWRGEFHNRKKNGELYWESAVISPLLDTAGRATHFVGIKEDITERKRAEAELLRQRTELAHTARVSTLGELAASVAHELNQPLGAILANAEAAELFLQKDPPALDELHDILAAIRKDDERAAEVIRRMRALLRKRELERHPLDLNAVVEDVWQLVSGDAALRGISLATDLVPALPKVSGDRVHLQQVLLNLILNGMDATADQPRDRRRLSVRTRLSADGQVELAVIDSGHGIEPDRLPRLFEPFYTSKPNGMGMGLSIARTIVEAHRGRIWAENNASGGAAFRLTLPASDKSPVATAASANPATPASD